MVAGMPPLESAWQGRWLLRFAEGYTGRANSVLPLGSPNADPAAAIDFVTSWYAERSAPALFQLFGPAGFDPCDHPLGSRLVGLGWRVFQRTLVMTAAAQEVAGPPAVPVEIADRPDERWWATASARETQFRPTASRINALIPDAAYLLADGKAVARLAFSAGWCGTFSVHTPQQYRRRGLARALMVAGAAEALSRNCPCLYLQVSADNTPAVRLYESLGYRLHHEYFYSRPA